MIFVTFDPYNIANDNIMNVFNIESILGDIMPFSEILKTRRTVRLYQQKPIPEKELEEIVDAARMAPSARNIQPLEYVVVDSEKLRKEMLPCIGLGGFVSSIVKDYSEKQPMAYAVVLVKKELKGNWTNHDCGLALENLVLAAWEKGIASCIVANINRDKIRSLLKIPEEYDIDVLVTLGYPDEKPVAEEMELRTEGGQKKEGDKSRLQATGRLLGESDTPVFRDGKGVLRVPKRPLRKILHRNGF